MTDELDWDYNGEGTWEAQSAQNDDGCHLDAVQHVGRSEGVLSGIRERIERYEEPMSKPPLIVKATDICGNCGDEFANHNYVPGSMTVYKCRTPHYEYGYGMFTGGPGAKFYPEDPTGGPGVWVVETEQFFEPLEPPEYEPDEEDYE